MQRIAQKERDIRLKSVLLSLLKSVLRLAFQCAARTFLLYPCSQLSALGSGPGAITRLRGSVVTSAGCDWLVLPDERQRCVQFFSYGIYKAPSGSPERGHFLVKKKDDIKIMPRVRDLIVEGKSTRQITCRLRSSRPDLADSRKSIRISERVATLAAHVLLCDCYYMCDCSFVGPEEYWRCLRFSRGLHGKKQFLEIQG